MHRLHHLRHLEFTIQEELFKTEQSSMNCLVSSPSPGSSWHMSKCPRTRQGIMCIIHHVECHVHHHTANARVPVPV